MIHETVTAGITSVAVAAATRRRMLLQYRRQCHSFSHHL